MPSAELKESGGHWALNNAPSAMQSFLIQTLGCKLNQLESEAITDSFLRAGFEQFAIDNNQTVTGGERTVKEPSIVIINTCTVTSKADQKARRVIRKALRDYQDSCVLVTGCCAQLNREDLLKLDNEKKGRLFVIKKDLIIDLPQYFTGSKEIGGVLENLKGSVETKNNVFQFNPKRFSFHTRSFLKIQDGCNNNCTYCAVRLARGSSISLNADEVLSRLRILEKNHGEAVLTGVNISQYFDKEADINLAGLLEYLIKGTEKIALRLSSLAPDSIGEEFAKILSSKRIRPHFHLSIQSCSKKILEKMGRTYDSKTIENAVSLLRRAKDDPFLACDIITGFPGETEIEFKETFELCKKLDFAWIHVFPYSRRPGTEAFSFPGTLREAEVSEQVQLFTDLAKQGRETFIRRWLNREVETLVEKSGAKTCRGISENYLKLHINYKGEKPPLPGTILQCKLQERPNTANDYDAIAEILPY
jgi:threonylcarbamoyladenosine tRNA methylthiotransferase MtaB